jgi:hypothetical protein
MLAQNHSGEQGTGRPEIEDKDSGSQDPALFRGELIHVQEAPLHIEFRVDYYLSRNHILNLLIGFLCPKAKKQKYKKAELHFLCEQLFLLV